MINFEVLPSGGSEIIQPNRTGERRRGVELERGPTPQPTQPAEDGTLLTTIGPVDVEAHSNSEPKNEITDEMIYKWLASGIKLADPNLE